MGALKVPPEGRLEWIYVGFCFGRRKGGGGYGAFYNMKGGEGFG